MKRKSSFGDKMIRLAGLAAGAALVLCGCAQTGDGTENVKIQEEQETAGGPETGWMPIEKPEEEFVSKGSGEGELDAEALNPKQKKVIDGYVFVDGSQSPVRLTMEIENILKGEEAYEELCRQDAEIGQPGEDEEYIIITLSVTYDEGETEELFLAESRALLDGAGLYFALSNSKSNTTDVTYCLENSIYNLSLIQGQSVQGSVAFLQEKNNMEPLHFVGFGQNVMFRVNLSRSR